MLDELGLISRGGDGIGLGNCTVRLDFLPDSLDSAMGLATSAMVSLNNDLFFCF